MLQILKTIIEKIIPFITKLIQGYKDRKSRISLNNDDSDPDFDLPSVPNINRLENVLTEKQQIRKEAIDFNYNDDELHQANKFSKKKYIKSVAVLHFSWTPTLESLTRYFISKNCKVNSTWGVGKDGTVHRYLPDPNNPSWTLGVRSGQPGGFIDHNGKWVRQLYNISTNFEIANINYEPYTEEQYEAVAVRLLWMLRYFKNYRTWGTTGHSNTCPEGKSDPGEQWDWEKMFSLMGVKQEFYNEYLRYLQDTAYNTVGNKERSARKWGIIVESVEKIRADLVGKPKDFCF